MCYPLGLKIALPPFRPTLENTLLPYNHPVNYSYHPPAFTPPSRPLFTVTPFPPITRLNTSPESGPRPNCCSRVNILPSPLLPHPAHVLHPPPSQLSQARFWAVRLNYSIPRFLPPPSSPLLVSCVLWLTCSRVFPVLKIHDISLSISIFPSLLSHVCADILPPLIPLSPYSRRSFFLCILFSPFPPAAHCLYLAFCFLSLLSYFRVPLSGFLEFFSCRSYIPHSVTIPPDVPHLILDRLEMTSDTYIDYRQSMSVEYSMPPLHIYVFSLTPSWQLCDVRDPPLK